MKRELSQIFKLKLLGVNIPGSDADGFITLSSAIPIEYEEEANKSSQGVSYKQTVDIYMDRTECPSFIARFSYFKAIVKLSDCVQEYVWGTSGVPVKVMSTPHFERILLSMSCESPSPIISY